MKVQVVVGAGGEMTGLHHDQFPLTQFGNARVERASDIVFDERAQKWDIYPYVGGQRCKLPLPGAAKGFDSYESARQFEVSWFQECQVAGCHPASVNGIIKAMSLRSASDQPGA